MKYELGAKLCKYRKAKNLSQKELADKIGVSNSRISNWEKGLNRPNAGILADLCRALDVSPNLLLDVYLTSDELSDLEREIINAYRVRTHLQHAVNVLLGVNNNFQRHN